MDEDFVYATDAEWDRAGAVEVGFTRPDQAWILSDRDCWYANPYYRGPAVPHPEDYDPGEEIEVCDQGVMFNDRIMPNEEELPW